MERTVTIGNGIEQVFSSITVDKVYGEGESLNPNKWQAQLRQIVTTKYPAARGNDSLSDALFDNNEFGETGGEGREFIENRVAFIGIPVGKTVEDVNAILKNSPNAKLQKILSLSPILSDEQTNAMQTGLSEMTLDGYKERQLVIDEDKNPALYAGQHPQYRVIKFRKSFVDDIDTRSADLDALGAVQVGQASAAKEFHTIPEEAKAEA